MKRNKSNLQKKKEDNHKRECNLKMDGMTSSLNVYISRDKKCYFGGEIFCVFTKF